jgi:hypothetical protein
MAGKDDKDDEKTPTDEEGIAIIVKAGKDAWDKAKGSKKK